MNPYILIGATVRTVEAASLSQRLAEWHDAMVAHERRLEAGRDDDRCADDCAHTDARALWAEALATFGDRAHALVFLRSRATGRSPRRRVRVRTPRQSALRRYSGASTAARQGE